MIMIGMIVITIGLTAQSSEGLGEIFQVELLKTDRTVSFYTEIYDLFRSDRSRDLALKGCGSQNEGPALQIGLRAPLGRGALQGTGFLSAASDHWGHG